MTTILEVNNLVTRFYTNDGVVHAVNGVSFDLEQGETLAVVGESGSGKSVSMMSLLRLIPEPPGRIERGEAIFFDGRVERDLLKLSRSEIRRIRGNQIGFIFQDPMSSLNPLLTIGLQIAESLVEHRNVSAEVARRQTIELLEHVGIPGAADRYNNYPHQFSGGMRQRVMIAIAIACSPKILIADEPTTALDVTVQAQIVDLTRRLRQELGLAVIWITHDLGVVAGLADRVLVMYGGTVVEEACVDDLYQAPQHPYTVGLLRALPRLDATDSERLESIEGVPPDLLVEPDHCPFAARCPYVFDRCRQELPPLYLVGERHRVACFYDLKEGRPRDER
jgi:oligopeptide transport system ATP-binding protein